MLPKDLDDDLLALLAANFMERSDGVKEAAQIRLILDDLAETMLRILSGFASAWSQANDVLRILPAEVLATCFTFLNMRDRITVSHVSRAWRSISLAHPAVWADISLMGTFRNDLAILEMALARTGQHPVDIWLQCELNSGGVQLVQSILVHHMHHLRYVKWSSAAAPIWFTLPAPLLETFWVWNSHMVIPDDFLGGLPGRLSTLTLATARFPVACPALSTVAHLKLEQPTLLADAESFTRLFRLCPRLQSLSLVYLKHGNALFLPAGPAPPTLNMIDLITDDPHYDLIQHYTAWKNGDNLSDVSLEMHGLTIADCKQQELIDFVSGADELGIECLDDVQAASFAARHHDQIMRNLIFCEGYNVSHVARLALLLGPGCGSVRRITLSLNTLGAFLDLSVLSVLKTSHFTLVFTGVPERKSPPWNSLSAFARALQDARFPSLKLVKLKVKAQRHKPALTAKEGRALCAAFQAVRNASPLAGPDIRVHGFTADVVHNLQLRIPEGLTFKT